MHSLNLTSWLRLRIACASKLLLLFLTLPTVVQAEDYTYTTNNDTITITGYTGLGGAATIPETINGLLVTSIGNSAFRYYTNLTNVTIPSSLTSIGGYAFQGCTSLTNIIIPNDVTNMGSYAFDHCTSLTAIAVDPLNAIYSSVDGVLLNKTQTTLIQCPGGKAGSYTIPNTVTNIGLYGFNSCTSLTSISIPDSVTSIGSFAFLYCTGLTNVSIGNNVNSIGTDAFQFCTSLANISIGSKVITIGPGAFYSCTNLTNITIPGSVTSIGPQAFQGCTILKGVYCKGNAPSVGGAAFSGDNNVTVYYLPGTTGWTMTFGGRPTVLWNPQVQTNDASLGVQSNKFGFTITGTSNLVIVVEAGANLANPIWTSVGTNTLIGGSSYFSDPQWTNYPTRLYRLRSP